MTTPTNNNVPSNSVQDRLFNAEKFDEFINSNNTSFTDRLGISRTTLNGIRQNVSNWMTSFSTENGAENVGYRTSNVGDVLSRMRTMSDSGLPRPYLGYSSTNDLAIFTEQGALPDTDLLLNGSITIGRKFRSIRRHAAALSLRGGRASSGDTGVFNAQITGVRNARGIAAYGLNDGVTLFADAIAPALEDWETVNTASYTATTVTVSPSVYSSFLTNVLVGDVIQTLHATKCWGLITGINQTTGVVTVDEWAIADGTTLTPTSGVGFNVNLINKVWAINANTIINSNSAANNAVICEFGAVVNKSGASLNGIDIPLLQQSLYDGVAGVLVRPASTSGKNWLYGFRSANNKMNFYAVSATYNNYVSTGSAPVGMRFSGMTAYSMLFSKSSDMTDLSYPNSTMIYDGYGRRLRNMAKYSVLTANATLNTLIPCYLINAAGITLTMPAISNMTSGHFYELKILRAGTYYITANAQEVNVSGYTTYPLTITAPTKVEVWYDGSTWIIVP